MAGSPIIPIQFFGKVKPLSEIKFEVEALAGKDDEGNPLDAAGVVKYVTDAKLVDFHASPAENGAGGHGEHHGGGEDEGHPG